MKRKAAIFLLVMVVGSHAFALGIMVPAYFYPGTLWTSMSNAATRVPLIAIMNPNNGPDTTQNPDYVAAVNSVRSAGGKVIGYVYTSYGARATNVVQTDIDRYFTFYSVDGIFLDEMTDDADTNHLNYYAALYQYIQGKGTNLTVVGNPGINTLEEYLTRPTADVLVTFEVNTGYGSYVPDGWVTNHLASHFCHLPYNVTNATTMTNYVNLAVSRNASWIYVTNDKGANPWDTLPTYWTNEVEFIRSLNQSVPTRLTVTAFSNFVPTLTISGAAGTYQIQATTNYFLSNWFSAGTVSAPAGTATLSDTNAIQSMNRFYRTAQ